MSEWKSISSCPEGVPVMTKIHDEKGERNVQTLIKRRGLFFAGGMYVYYNPTHWKEAAMKEYER